MLGKKWDAYSGNFLPISFLLPYVQQKDFLREEYVPISSCIIDGKCYKENNKYIRKIVKGTLSIPRAAIPAEILDKPSGLSRDLTHGVQTISSTSIAWSQLTLTYLSKITL